MALEVHLPQLVRGRPLERLVFGGLGRIELAVTA
jgi:hypothetical protein